MFSKVFNSILFPFVNIRNSFYNYKIFSQVKSIHCVISIGNISFGGTGKTTLTIFLCKKLLENQINPIVLSRGYRRKSKETIIFPSEGIEPSVEVLGDELLLIHQKLNIPIAVSRRKYKAIEFIDNLKTIDVILVDDGFQHRKLFRDLDIVLIDQNTFNGYLREPLDSIKRANVVLLEKGINRNLVPNGNFVIFEYEKYIKRFYDLSGKNVQIEDIVKEPVALVSGIGNNSSFNESMEQFHIHIVKHFKFYDHYYYKLGDIQKIIFEMKKYKVNTLVTTEKDLVKLIQFKEIFKEQYINIFACEIDLKIDKEKDLIGLVLQTITQRRMK